MTHDTEPLQKTCVPKLPMKSTPMSLQMIHTEFQVRWCIPSPSPASAVHSWLCIVSSVCLCVLAEDAALRSAVVRSNEFVCLAGIWDVRFRRGFQQQLRQPVTAHQVCCLESTCSVISQTLLDCLYSSVQNILGA